MLKSNKTLKTNRSYREKICGNQKISSIWYERGYQIFKNYIDIPKNILNKEITNKFILQLNRYIKSDIDENLTILKWVLISSMEKLNCKTCLLSLGSNNITICINDKTFSKTLDNGDMLIFRECFDINFKCIGTNMILYSNLEFKYQKPYILKDK